MKKKIIAISMIIFLLVVFLVGLYFVMFKNTDKIVLSKDKFVFELGEDISADVSYYLKDADSTKNIKSYRLTSEELNIVRDKFSLKNSDYIGLGKYKIVITYKNIKKEFIIKIEDTTSPKFEEFKEVIELEATTDSVDIKSYFRVKDLSDVKVEIEGDYNLKIPGEYKIKVVAIDSSDNKSEKESLIKVIEKPKEQVLSKEETPKNDVPKTPSNTTTPSNSTTNKTESPVVASPKYRKDISDIYVAQVNSYRKANGLSELPVTTEAQNEADRRAKEISTYYSHDGVGYGFGENIGEGSVGVDFFTAWKNSPSHNAAMLREQNTAIAASVYEVNNHWFAVISFRMNY